MPTTIRSRSRLRSRRGAALAVLVCLLTMLRLSSASAAPGDPIDPPDDPPPPDFIPPENGFDWAMDARFGPRLNGIVDYHWNQAWPAPLRWGTSAANREQYDPAHVHPSSFGVGFQACPTQDEFDRDTSGLLTLNTYTLTVEGVAQPSRRTCSLRHSFTRQGPHTVTLTIAGPDAGTFTQTVTIKDHLIVSMGDSYASGEGNPDIAGDYYNYRSDAPAQWVDRRCHRSANAAPAQAALRLENADPHTSVTFLSFACSGATINRNYNGGTPAWDPYEAGDPTKPLGSGIIGSARGPEPPDPNVYTDHVQSQIRAMAIAAHPRRIDALLMSAGGNDIGFGPVAAACIWAAACVGPDAVGNIYHVTSATGGPQVTLQTRFEQDRSFMAGRYAALNAALTNPNPPDRFPLRIAKAFITQYPDPATQLSGTQVVVCDEILEDIAWQLGSKVDGQEITFARSTVLPGLNGAVAAAASTHGWTLVDGHLDDFLGHGYCVGNSDQPNSQRWIRTAAEAELTQGPFNRSQTTGTLHPTTRGLQAYAEALEPLVRDHLQSLPPDNRPPVASAGPDQTVNSSANFFLNGNASQDPESRPLGFLWTQVTGPAAVIRNPRSSQTEVVGVRGPATLAFRLTVTDAGGLTHSDDVVVTVRAAPK